jgi:hypothetical protein
MIQLPVLSRLSFILTCAETQRRVLGEGSHTPFHKPFPARDLFGIVSCLYGLSSIFTRL